jgi:hypothetical protein
VRVKQAGHTCALPSLGPPSVSHSLQIFSPLADSRSCEIDSCHMFDHMALSRVRGRKVCGSCLTSDGAARAGQALEG